MMAVLFVLVGDLVNCMRWISLFEMEATQYVQVQWRPKAMASICGIEGMVILVKVI